MYLHCVNGSLVASANSQTQLLICMSGLGHHPDGGGGGLCDDLVECKTHSPKLSQRPFCFVLCFINFRLALQLKFMARLFRAPA